MIFQKRIGEIKWDRVNSSVQITYLRKYQKNFCFREGIRNKDIVAQLQVHGVEVSTGTYSKIELGINNPSVDLLIALTEILDCDFNAFFKR